MQRVDVKVDEQFAAVLREYCAHWRMTLGELMYEAAKQHIHSSSHICEFTDALLKKQGIPPDKRSAKSCYGYLCRTCKHLATCRVGLYKHQYEIADKYEHQLKAHLGSYPFDPCQKSKNSSQ